MMGENNDSRTERLSIDELQHRLVDRVPEDAFPASYNNRKDWEPVLVDKVVLHQTVTRSALPKIRTFESLRIPQTAYLLELYS